MKKLLFMGALLLSASSFANDKCEEEKEILIKEGCCTAYLMRDGVVVDSQEFCGSPSGGVLYSNCKMAQQILLDRHKDINPSGQI